MIGIVINASIKILLEGENVIDVIIRGIVIVDLIMEVSLLVLIIQQKNKKFKILRIVVL